MRLARFGSSDIAVPWVVSRDCCNLRSNEKSSVFDRLMLGIHPVDREVLH